ncbi:twin-arginine translocation signal domain-containing protein, partial [Kriegella sp. EG-1]|nr:twin-arginine translocation signal domain-containing protein [Flavobacteriaceae bacterium EG-1]MRI02597.1 twin-arginine translocation signal domain-containing protein [Flavobacteriaceae bacterium EG-1]
MKNNLKRLIAQNKKEEQEYAAKRKAEINNPKTGDKRRDFLKKTALGGIALSSFMGYSFEDTVAETTSKVNRSSSPSELKITDMRYALTKVMGGTAIIRIDT